MWRYARPASCRGRALLHEASSAAETDGEVPAQQARDLPAGERRGRTGQDREHGALDSWGDGGVGASDIHRAKDTTHVKTMLCIYLVVDA